MAGETGVLNKRLNYKFAHRGSFCLSALIPTAIGRKDEPIRFVERQVHNFLQIHNVIYNMSAI